jgi:hypothetical protein
VSIVALLESLDAWRLMAEVTATETSEQLATSTDSGANSLEVPGSVM